MDMSKDKGQIQLEGKELDEMCRLERRVDAELRELGQRVLLRIYGKSGSHNIKSMRIIFNNTKIFVYDEKNKLVGVWQNPPGVCRKPTAKEVKENPIYTPL
jgi:hypothetical protein